MFRTLNRLLLSSVSSVSTSTSSPNVLHATQTTENKLNDLSPRKIALILDKYIVGQTEGKRAVAISLRNRWRRRQIANLDLRKEVLPKNMLLIGPTGVGKTEISRRMARITDAPFVKVEATKYTEVGFKGKDVESIIEDLYTNAKGKARKLLEAERHSEALAMAVDTVYNAWVTLKHKQRNAFDGGSSGNKKSTSTSSKGNSNTTDEEDSNISNTNEKEGNVDDNNAAAAAAAAQATGNNNSDKSKSGKSKKKSKKDKSNASSNTDSESNKEESKSKTSKQSNDNGDNDNDENSEDKMTLEYFREHYADEFAQDKVFIDVAAPQDPSHHKSSSASGGVFNAQAVGILIGLGVDPRKSRVMVWKTVSEAIPLATQEALNKLMDETQVNTLARALAEEEGIVFIDEIDKVVVEKNTQAADVSATGVQQDLLPLVEGSNVTMKDGSVIATDNMLFICSGAFHTAKTSDMIAELQGRLPVRVELKALSEDDFRRILTEPKYNLLLQHTEMMKTEGVEVEFTADGINALAKVTCLVNTQGQNIGARRLNTILERVMDEYSFNCDTYANQKVIIDEKVVRDATEKLQKNISIAKYLL